MVMKTKEHTMNAGNGYDPDEDDFDDDMPSKLERQARADAEREKDSLTITTVARRITRECNDTNDDVQIYFDKDGRYIASHEYGMFPSCGYEAFAPGYAYMLPGCRVSRYERGHMTQRAAQIFINGIDRYKGDIYAIHAYEDVMNGVE